MCDQRERLMDYLYDEAAPAERRLVESHLEACADCRDEMRAFRRVREDLLAWEVPDSPSVWTPFAPTAPTPWHRQVPTWAMAAAAGVMLMVGTAGGFFAHTLAASRPGVSVDRDQAVNAAVPPPPVAPVVVRDVAPVPAAMRDADVLTMVRSELTRLERQRAAAPGPDTEALVQVAAEKQWAKVYGWLQVVADERELERKNYDQRISRLQSQIDDLHTAFRLMNTAQNQTKGIQ